MKKILIIALILLPAVSLGQTTISGSADLSVSVSPANPGPNASTTIKINSYLINTTQASITWLLNGKKVLGGIGKKEFSFKTGPLGTKSDVVVSAIYDGRLFEKKLTFYQNDVDLMWETINGYAPGFYEGKIFPAPGSEVKVVAMPNIFSGGKKIASDKLTYTWSKNFKKSAKDSGVGKNTFIFRSDALTNNNVVEVQVLVPGSAGAVVRRSISIPSPALQVIVYEYKPLVGALYGRGLKGEFRPAGREAGLKAEIFNLNQNDRDGLEFNWLLNNKPLATDPTDPNSILITESNSTSSRSFLSLSVENPLNIFQSARELLTIYLGSGVQF